MDDEFVEPGILKLVVSAVKATDFGRQQEPE
jgi:hypothetical protein